jgi:hypothetical protein
MSIGPPPIEFGPIGLFQTLASVQVPVYAADASGRPSVTSTTTTANVPCSIQSGAGSEASRYGGGLAIESRSSFTGYFPARMGGSVLSIPAQTRIVADGVTYEAVGAAMFSQDGMQVVGLEVIQ